MICDYDTYQPFVQFAEDVLGVDVIVMNTGPIEGQFIRQHITDDNNHVVDVKPRYISCTDYFPSEYPRTTPHCIIVHEITHVMQYMCGFYRKKLPAHLKLVEKCVIPILGTIRELFGTDIPESEIIAITEKANEKTSGIYIPISAYGRYQRDWAFRDEEVNANAVMLRVMFPDDLKEIAPTAMYALDKTSPMRKMISDLIALQPR